MSDTETVVFIGPKATVDVKALLEVVSIVTKIVPAKHDNPLASCLRLTFKEDEIEVAGTNMEVFLRYKIPAKPEHEGKVVLNAARLHGILKELDGTVTLDVDEGGCEITSGKARFKILGASVLSYPKFPKIDKKAVSIELPAATLVNMIKRTIFAVSGQGGRFSMNGVLFDLAEDRLRLVGTDSRRLALAEKKLKITVTTPVEAVVPVEGLELLSRLIEDEDKSVVLRHNATCLSITTKRATMTARLLTGTFPPYKKVFDMVPKAHVDVDRASFQTALRQAALLTSKEGSAVAFSFSKEGLELSARSAEAGEASIQFDLVMPDEFKTGFNPVYLQDGLKTFGSDKVRVSVQDGSPIFLRALVESKKIPGKLIADPLGFYLVVPVQFE